MTLICEVESPGFENRKVISSLEKILQDSSLLSLATTREGAPYINTAYFAFDSLLNLVIFTPPSTVHAQNIAQNPTVAIAVYSTEQPVGADLVGLQLFGDCALADTASQEEAFETYAQRFQWLQESAPNASAIEDIFDSRLYVIQVDKIKLFDEPSFGKEVWVDAQVRR